MFAASAESKSYPTNTYRNLQVPVSPVINLNQTPQTDRVSFLNIPSDLTHCQWVGLA